DTATARSLRYKRNDVVRFRKRSQIAVGLGAGFDKEFKVEIVTTEKGRTMVVLRVGKANSRGFDESIVLVEVVERRVLPRHLEQPDLGRHPLEHTPVDRDSEQRAEGGQDVVDRLA